MDMNKLYMGIDTGSAFTKGVIIDEYDNIIASVCLATEGDPIKASKDAVNILHKSIDDECYRVVSVGTTGSARKLIGTLFSASVIENEIKAMVSGTLKIYPDAKTIFEIGSNNSKILLIDDGKIVDYNMNGLCMSGGGPLFLHLLKGLAFL